MRRYFYSHIINLDSLIFAIGEMDISQEEKDKLEQLAHEQLHSTIIDVILNELTERDKKIFLANLNYESQEIIWKHLNQKADKIGEKITQAAVDLKKVLHHEISETLKN